MAITVTGFFAYYQDASATKLLEGFNNLVPLQALVIRDGEKILIDVENLTVGDLVELKGGDKVPAGKQDQEFCF